MLSLNISTLLVAYAPPSHSFSDKNPSNQNALWNPSSCPAFILRHDMWWWSCDDDDNDGDGVCIVPCPCLIKHTTNPPTTTKKISQPFTMWYEYPPPPFIFLHLRTCRIWLVCNLSLKAFCCILIGFTFSVSFLHLQSPTLPWPVLILYSNACVSCMATFSTLCMYQYFNNYN